MPGASLLPQFIALIIVIAIPIVVAYLGFRGGLQLWLAKRRKRGHEFWRTEKRWFVPVLAANLFLVALLAYGWICEARWVERVEVRLEADVAHPLRFVHLSDLHLEGWGYRESKAIEIANAAEADLVLLTGDYVSRGTGDAYADDVRRFAGSLRAKAGIFAVPGNWDANLVQWFDETAVVLLAGKSSRVDLGGVQVTVRGEWYDMAPPPADPAGDFTIYLQHSPDFLKEASDAGYDLYLAGHTHGGQVRIPWFGAVVTLSRFWKKYESGLFQEGKTYLYVNRGLGLEGGWAPRVRLFCRPEVTIIEIVPRLESP